MGLISCLCITRGRPHLLAEAVADFQAQTHADRELVIVADDDDAPTLAYLGQIEAPSLRPIILPRLVLGAKRNRAIAAAHGAYVAVWDDDDRHAPERLARQLDEINRTGQPAVVLERVLIHTPQGAYMSRRRTWENTLVCRRADQPAYQPLPRGSDSPVVAALADAGKLARLDSPALYVYRHHGQNVWNLDHFHGLTSEPATAEAFPILNSVGNYLPTV